MHDFMNYNIYLYILLFILLQYLYNLMVISVVGFILKKI